MNKPASGTMLTLLFAVPVLWLLMGAVTLRDPTRPPNVTTPAEGTAAQASGQGDSLTAIFDYPDHQVAIINNQVMRVGDRIGEFTITAITPYTVELTGPNNTRQVLELVSTVKEATH